MNALNVGFPLLECLMKLFKLGSLAALLIPVAIALTSLSFLLDSFLVRITLQVLAIIALCMAALLGQRMVDSCQKTLDGA